MKFVRVVGVDGFGKGKSWELVAFLLVSSGLGCGAAAVRSERSVR